MSQAEGKGEKLGPRHTSRKEAEVIISLSCRREVNGEEPPAPTLLLAQFPGILVESAVESHADHFQSC